MNRRNFFKKSAIALGYLAATSLLDNPLMAYDMNNARMQPENDRRNSNVD